MQIGLLNGPAAGTPKAEQVYLLVRNNETSSIPAGTPVCFAMNATRDGIDVQLPATGTDAKNTGFFAGVSEPALAASSVGLVQCYGFTSTLLLTRQTRATSTDSYASAAALALGDWLNVESVGNGASRSGAGSVSVAAPILVAAQSLASAASSASTSSDSSVKVQSTIKAFIRAM